MTNQNLQWYPNVIIDDDDKPKQVILEWPISAVKAKLMCPSIQWKANVSIDNDINKPMAQ